MAVSRDFTPTSPRAVAPSQQIAPSRHFGWGPLEMAKLGVEWVDAVKGPGAGVFLSGRDVDRYRRSADRRDPVIGLHLDKGAAPRIETIPNPDSADGSWDPLQFLPRFVFAKDEDAYPVDPAFDGDADLKDNAPATANGKARAYDDGRIGGDQPLNAAFTVSRKGGYTVLTYSFYYAHNKAGRYHANDYSTAQVFLKPGPDGRLAPTHLFTSWHHGGLMTRWENLGKDAAGRPIIAVERGSHALEVYAKDQSLSKDGLQIAADGRAVLNGRPTAFSLNFDALQPNVKGARVLDPASIAGQTRIKMLRWGAAAENPFLPSTFKGRSPWKELGSHLLDRVQKAWGWAKGLLP